MAFERCTTCNRFGWTDTHICPPRWEVYFPDFSGPDYPQEVYAADASEAVAVAAEENDCDGDYTILRGAGHVFKAFVRRYGADGWEALGVYGESLPHYSTQGWEDD